MREDLGWPKIRGLTMTNLQSLQIIWQTLYSYREDSISEGDKQNDDVWGAVCEAMAHLHETLEINQSEID